MRKFLSVAQVTAIVVLLSTVAWQLTFGIRSLNRCVFVITLESVQTVKNMRTMAVEVLCSRCV